MKIIVLIFLLTFSYSRAQHPSVIDPTLKEQWCKASINTCESICRSRNVVPAASQCSGLNLLENCLCTDGFAPVLDNYENTVSYFICEYNRPSGPCTNTCYLNTLNCIKLSNNGIDGKVAAKTVAKEGTAGAAAPGGGGAPAGGAPGPGGGGGAPAGGTPGGGGGAPAGGTPGGGGGGPAGGAPGGGGGAPAGGTPGGGGGGPAGGAPGGGGGAPAGGTPGGGGGGPAGGAPGGGGGGPAGGPTPGGGGGGPAGGAPVPGGKVPGGGAPGAPGAGKIPADGPTPTNGGNVPQGKEPTNGGDIPSDPSGTAPKNSDDTSSNSKNVSIAIGISASLSSIMIAVALIIWCRRRYNKTQSGHFFDIFARNIGNAFSGNSSEEEKRISTLKAGLVKGDAKANSSGDYSSVASNLPIADSSKEVIFLNRNSDAQGILITKTQSVSIHQDSDYFGTNSFLSTATKSDNSMENLTGVKGVGSSSESGYLANSSNLNTSSDDNRITL